MSGLIARGFARLSALAASGGAALVGFIQAGAGAVSRWVQDKLRESVSLADFGADLTGAVDSTAAVQAAINAAQGKRLLYPRGVVKHGPVTVPHSVHFVGEPGSSVVPVFDAGTLQKLYEITADDVTIKGMKTQAVAGVVSQNKYIFHVQGAKRFKAIGNTLEGANVSDGLVGSSNLLVCHGFYLNGVEDAAIRRNRINVISGAAVFMKNAKNCDIGRNHITDTGWYSINADEACEGIDIHHNVIDGTNTNARNWGGSVNVQSNTLGAPCKRIDVRHNIISGVHNYGSAVRIQSLTGGEVVGNHIFDAAGGAIAPGGVAKLQYISIDRRGTAEGAPENGPCRDLTIADNVLTAGAGNHQGIYLKNQYKATRDPHENIAVIGNVIRSTPGAYFETAISVHGYKSGFAGLRVAANRAQVITGSGAPVSGAIGLVSTNADGAIYSADVTQNRIEDVSGVAPSNTSQVGIFGQQTLQEVCIRDNTLKGFYYGVRTAAGADVFGVHENAFAQCLTNVLDQAKSRSGWDYSRGEALPVSGVYEVGHIRQKTNAAASASWGWIVTTAGGAMVGEWASGATYVAGVWYRNAAGRVYELVTAGGGTTSVAPTHTTIGQEVTGADGYTWRCRATTSARWATLPNLGAAAALP